MGSACMKQKRSLEDSTLLAAQTCFKANEIKILYELFKKLSSSIVDDGLTSQEEFQLGLFGNTKRKSFFADRIFQLFDTEQRGAITFGEFVRCLSVFHPEAPQVRKVEFAFQLHDIGKTWFIERDNVKKMISALLEESYLILPDEIIEAMIIKTFMEADYRGDGKIDMEEWKLFVDQSFFTEIHDNSI